MIFDDAPVQYVEPCMVVREDASAHHGLDGWIDYDAQSFDATMGKIFAEEMRPTKRLREMFDAIDLDGNGVLDAHEIRLVLPAIGEDDVDIITRIVASVDLNHDGGVSWGKSFKKSCALPRLVYDEDAFGAEDNDVHAYRL